MGAFALVRFVLDEVVKPSGENIRVDWHGHCDRGLAVANSIAALTAGAECVHACALGIGERVGNTQMDQVLVNLKLMGVSPWAEQNLTKLKEYCQVVSEGHRRAHSRELSGGGRRCVSHRDWSPRRRRHQSVQEERYRPCKRRVLWRALANVWSRTNH